MKRLMVGTPVRIVRTDRCIDYAGHTGVVIGRNRLPIGGYWVRLEDGEYYFEEEAVAVEPMEPRRDRKEER